MSRLVDDEELVTANALNELNNNLARLVGPSLGAATLALAVAVADIIVVCYLVYVVVI